MTTKRPEMMNTPVIISHSAAAGGAIEGAARHNRTSESFYRLVKSRANRESSNTRMHDLKLLLNQYGSYAVNFKVESLQFKATCSDMLMKLMQFTEAAQQREDYWRRRLERESERRRKAEDMVTGLLQDSATAGSHFRPFRANHIPTQAASILPAVRMGPGKAHQRSHSHGGAIGTLPTNNGMAVSTVTSNDVKMMLITEPGYQEGPDFNMAEEQFYDAIDAQLEKMRQDEAYLAALKSVGDKLRSANAMPSTHPLYNEVSKVCEERMDIFRGFPGPNDDGAACSGEGWNVVAKQGEMTIYNREVESADGNYLDPLQVTAPPLISLRNKKDVKSIKSAILAHLVDTGHSVDPSEAFRVIYKVPPNHPKPLGQRLLAAAAEATAIRLKKSVLCAQKNLVQAPRIAWSTAAKLHAFPRTISVLSLPLERLYQTLTAAYHTVSYHPPPMHTSQTTHTNRRILLI
ncbi:unnamed protein product [Schistocephalus solidus]|uniref:Uncharacterized protein n=1 Tax=Schistocephalus solidus TaxID=70667 RepID=A0A183TIG5_SCHSO|nr:unnamed protein product [Schistocephalus solidus]